MFDKPFEQLFQALQRIEKQLATAGDDEKEILREEILALRTVCDRFVEKWLIFEEKVADLSELFGLQIDLTEPYLNPSKPPAKSPSPGKVVPLHPNAAEEQIIRWFRKGLGYMDLLMFPHAINELEKVVNMDGEFSVARLYLALGYLGKREYEKAEGQLALVAADAEDPYILAAVHNTFGHIYAEREDFLRAAEEFKQAAEYSRDFPDVHFNLGACQYNQKLYTDALASFLVSADTNPDDWQTEYIIALIWQRLGSMDKAYEHAAKAYRLNSSDLETMLLYADLLVYRNECKPALTLYEKARKFYPLSPGPLGGIGWLTMREGNYNLAIAYFKKQLSLSPGDNQAQFNLGWAFLMTGEVGKAEQLFKHLLLTEPDLIHARIGMARVLQMLDKQEDAQRLLETVTRAEDPHDRLLGHLQVGRLFMEQGNYESAVDQFSKALQLDNNCVEAWFYKGLAHTGLGEHELAESCWRLCRDCVPAIAGT
ncbi:tetratricopeptide repeat protein [Effusibacillus lacus]|uniref:Uncharacterized protein n=1 Tax=Effusibacillus lacus TaxID=1348429 RepID=A0A292YGP4_9BACL|nr:tetratricopeptide repeat protein [Effusibacillus lacus]TCS75333.1 Tfp pilus assembly protein PilF [Effusibacillus lacus]GAX89767.1 hypothetical protein EFBL_1392 [Effusibacillus lacus]